MSNRNLYLWLVLSAAVALSSGCSSLPTHSGKTTASQPEVTAGPSSSPPLPHVELSSELLYRLLVAEFAGQSGAPGFSAEQYYAAAEQTRDPRLAKSAAQMAIYANNTQLALKAATLWNTLAPEDIEAVETVAGVLIAVGQTAESRPYLEKIIASAPGGEGHGYLIVATLLERDSDKARALKMMEELTAAPRDEAGAQFAYATLAFQQGNAAVALQTLDTLLKNHPDYLQGLILKARLLHAQGKKQEALDTLASAVKQAPDNTQLRLTYARMLVDARQLKLARKEFRTINRQSPEDPDVIYALGLLALQANDIDDAEQQFQQLLELQQREPEANFALGQIAESRNETDKAISYYEAVNGGENTLEARLRAAMLIAKRDGVDKARDYIHSLTPETGADSVRIALMEGELLREAQRYDDAMAVYDDALALLPDNTELLYARAMMAERVDRLDILERDLRTILKKDPDNVQALNALGYTLADRTNRYAEAQQLIAKALKLSPDDAAILDSMGWVLYRTGHNEEAIGYLKRALAKQDDGEIAAHLGEVLWVSGQQKEARQVWDKALKQWPDHTILRQTIERFTK